MSDTDFLRDRLDRLARTEDASTFDISDDVARGRTQLLHRRVVAGGAAALAGTVVLGTVLAVGSAGSAGLRQRPPGSAGGGPTAAATYHEPAVTLTPSTGPTAPDAPASPTYERIRHQIDSQVGPGQSPFPGWRNELFRTTRSVLDPAGRHLGYGSDSLQAGSDETGVGLGIKMGWKNPGSPGEGMVQVEVTTEGGSDTERCVLMSGFECSASVQADGVTMKVGDGSDGTFVVLHRQPDGDRVLVLVDPLFGNSSVTPVRDMGVTKQDVYRLVQDDRLNLPD